MTRRSRPSFGWTAALAVTAMAVAACSPDGAPTSPALTPSFSNVGGGAPPGEVVLCKYTEMATPATFDFDVTATGGNVPGNGRFTLNSVNDLVVGHECEVVWTATDDSQVTVTIAEDVPDGWELYAMFVDGIGFIDPVSNPLEVEVSSSVGRVVYFKNRPGEMGMIPGRMTGGGGQVTLDGVYVTRGFTIHCDITLSNNVEINWEGNRWHLDKPLTSAICIDDPAVEPAPPPAPFDTFIGEGLGRLNNVDGSFLRFTFVDSGEPGGKQDRATINIWAPGDDPDVDSPVLSVDGLLDRGNLQAHYDQPHKNK